jgi:hypothetical protein
MPCFSEFSPPFPEGLLRSKQEGKGVEDLSLYDPYRL